MKRKPTPQQEDIILDIAHGDGNTVGRARAGTGKTSCLEMAGEEVPASTQVIACAFNADIAKVLQGKLPAHWTTRTTHSIGFGGVRAYFARSLEVEPKKNKAIIQRLDSGRNFPDLDKAISIAKAWGIVPRGALASPQGLFPDDLETYQSLFSRYGIDTGWADDPIGMLRQALLDSIKEAWKGTIDFDDMLYLAYIYNCPLPQGDLVLIDEAQDIAPIQRGILRQMMRPGARLAAIGDDRQAIYGFRGADRQSLPNIIQEFNCKILPLTVSFRCPRAVIAEAQQIVPDIEAWEGAEDGEVVRPEEIGLEEFTARTAILCRNNAPLFQACLKFIRAGIGASIIGRDVAVGLHKMIDRQRANSLQELMVKLEDDAAKRISKMESKGQDSQAALLRDKVDCIHHLIHFVGKSSSVWDLKKKLDLMFKDKENVIRLSTIHKAKGLEWEHVHILDPGLIPSKWAKTADEREQEYNLKYVAITRALRRLSYITSEGLVE